MGKAELEWRACGGKAHASMVAHGYALCGAAMQWSQDGGLDLGSRPKCKKCEQIASGKYFIGKAARAKGASAERELFKLLSERLGFVVKRNLSQSRGGGADGIDIPGWSIEVKRHETPRLETWWQQALEQAHEDEHPVLAYRASRRPWAFRVPLYTMGVGVGRGSLEWTAEIGLEAFCELVREKLED